MILGHEAAVYAGLQVKMHHMADPEVLAGNHYLQFPPWLGYWRHWMNGKLGDYVVVEIAEVTFFLGYQAHQGLVVQTAGFQ